jgi:hypothetical protein
MTMGEPMMIEPPTAPAHRPMMGRVAFEPLELPETPSELTPTEAPETLQPVHLEELMGDVTWEG